MKIKRMYVWIDAVLGYLTDTMKYVKKKEWIGKTSGKKEKITKYICAMEKIT